MANFWSHDKWQQVENKEVHGGMEVAYKWFQGLFQTPWESYKELCGFVTARRNAMEYCLLEPERLGAFIHPLLPLALADAARLLMGALGSAGEKTTIWVKDSTPGLIRHRIASTFEDVGGCNMDIELLNDVIREKTYIIMWSEVFSCLASRKHNIANNPFRREEFSTKYRDGSDRVAKRIGPAKPRYIYTSMPDALVALFGGDRGLAEAHFDTAQALANKQDWRIQHFIHCSEHTPLRLVDGVPTDTTKGAWYRRHDLDAHRVWVKDSEP